MIASSWRDIYDGGVKRFYNVLDLDDLYGNIIGYKECVMILYNGRLFPSENMFRLLYSNWISGLPYVIQYAPRKYCDFQIEYVYMLY